jgi:hypothetical protein
MEGMAWYRGEVKPDVVANTDIFEGFRQSVIE